MNVKAHQLFVSVCAISFFSATTLPAYAQDTAPAAQTTQSSSAPQFDDKKIHALVKRELKSDPVMAGRVIEIKVTDGVVRLVGTTNSLLTKERAVRVAQTVKGVRSVVDQLIVTPVERSDEQIAQDVKWAVLANLATQELPIDTAAKSGVVTLSGAVESPRARAFAERVAKSVLGIKAVNNQISVKPNGDRTDEEIKKQIQQALAWDRLVDSALIQVEVDKGVVTLFGHVGSAAERERAIQDAQVAGISKVDHDNLLVEPWLPRDKLRKEKYGKKSDADIKQAVKQTLDVDPRLAGHKINVSVDAGHVTLSGQVASPSAVYAATEDANNTVGVWRVQNLLEIPPARTRLINTDMTDEQIQENLSHAFSIHSALQASEIKTFARDGLVTLSGSVDTPYEKAYAETVAWHTAGVDEVKNNISVVRDGALTFRPYVDDWDITYFDWHKHITQPSTDQSDQQIKEEIYDELVWSPFLNADEINVKVKEGVATLTGAVDTWMERNVASENALDGGAIFVRNELAVRFGPQQ